MATHKASLLRAPPGLLLLLIGVISSHLPDVQARPIDFWCKSQAREIMRNKSKLLSTDMEECVGSDPLSSSVQLPCVWVNNAEWTNKSLQQKHAEVVEALQMFQDGVQAAKNQSTLQCQTSLLEKLGYIITNHLDIVSSLQIQNDSVTPTLSSGQNCSSQTSLDQVPEQYVMLLRGKLERFATDLKDNHCKAEHRTANTK